MPAAGDLFARAKDFWVDDLAESHLPKIPNGSEPDISPGGTLMDIAAAGSGPQLFLTGRDPSNQVWWYETPGAGWKFVGAAGVAAGPLSAAAR